MYISQYKDVELQSTKPMDDSSLPMNSSLEDGSKNPMNASSFPPDLRWNSYRGISWRIPQNEPWNAGTPGILRMNPKDKRPLEKKHCQSSINELLKMNSQKKTIHEKKQQHLNHHQTKTHLQTSCLYFSTPRDPITF